MSATPQGGLFAAAPACRDGGRFWWIAFTATALIFCATAPRASAVLVTYFNFEDGNFVSDPAVPAPLQTATITTTFPGVNGYSFPAGNGSTLNTAPGNIQSTNTSLRLDTDKGANNGSYIQFSVSTVGLSNLSLSYATRNNSGHGFPTQTLSYSTNGTSFTTFGTFAPDQTNNYQLASFDLSGVTAINGNASVIFRLTFTGAGNGNNEFVDLDNIQLTTGAVPEPGTFVGGGLALLAAGWLQRRRVKYCSWLWQRTKSPG